MTQRPPRSTRDDTPCPYTTRCRSSREASLGGGGVALILAALIAVFLTVRLERRRKAEQRLVTIEALRETERRLADIAKNFPGIIYQRVLHPDGRVSLDRKSTRLNSSH